MLTQRGAWEVDVLWSSIDRFFDGLGAAVDFDPDFQRHHVWNAARQQSYVEFILRGGQTAKLLYFNCLGWPAHSDEPVILVDGKQRLEAVRLFMADERRIFGGWKLSDFQDRDRLLRFHNASFKVHINDLATRDEVLRWYIDINDGGVAHTATEIERVRAMIA